MAALSEADKLVYERNKKLMTIAHLLTPEHRRQIKALFLSEKNKAKPNFEKIKELFHSFQYESLVSSFEEWKRPFEGLVL